jgi:hypothetical protein
MGPSMQNQLYRRAVALVMVLLSIAAVIIWRLTYLQLVQAD